MNRSTIAVLLVASAIMFRALAAGTDRELPGIGQEVQRSSFEHKTTNLCMTAPSQMDSCIADQVDGITYRIAFRPVAKSRKVKIIYITTNDPSFVSVGGLRVGGVVTIVDRSQLVVIPGWEIYGPETKDGWLPVVGFSGELQRPGETPSIRVEDISTATSRFPIELRIVAFTKR